MGRKVHPTGFRLGIIRDWQARWYADKKQYANFLLEDMRLRGAIHTKYTEAGISAVDIERQANKVAVTIHTSRPGIVIGRGGQRVDEMRSNLESLLGKRIQLNIQEIHQPELDAYLVARSVADQIERRIAYRRAMKQTIFRTMQAGAKGVRITCSGRLGGAEIARRQTMHEGRVPLHTIRADIDYGFAEAHTTMGRLGVKVWLYKGDILPEIVTEAEEVPTAAAAVPVAETEAPAETAPTPEPQAEAAELVVQAAQPAASEVSEEKKAKPPAETAPAPARRVRAAKPTARKTKPSEEKKTKSPAEPARAVEPEEEKSDAAT